MSREEKRLINAIRCALADLVYSANCLEDTVFYQNSVSNMQTTFVELYRAAEDMGYDVEDYKSNYEEYKELLK
jgi:hypothetical protein